VNQRARAGSGAGGSVPESGNSLSWGVTSFGGVRCLRWERRAERDGGAWSPNGKAESQ